MKKLLIFSLLISSIGSFAQSKPVQAVVVPAPTKGNLPLLNREEAKLLLVQVNSNIINDTIDNLEDLALQKQLKDFLKSKGKTNTIKDVPAKYVKKTLAGFQREMEDWENKRILLDRKWGILEEWIKVDTALRIFDENVFERDKLKAWVKKKKEE
jgi:hypothetical protein